MQWLKNVQQIKLFSIILELFFYASCKPLQSSVLEVGCMFCFLQAGNPNYQFRVLDYSPENPNAYKKEPVEVVWASD